LVKNTNGLIEKMVKQRSYSKYTLDAAQHLAELIKLGRKERKWSEKNLADRVNISTNTLRKIESGEMSSSIGLVFEVAVIVGIKFFDSDNNSLSKQIEQTQDKIALLPKRIHPSNKKVKDDF